MDAFFTEAAQIGLVVQARRRVEIRHIIVPEGEIEIAFFGDAHGFVEGGGVVGQHAQHFFVAFEIKLVAFKAHAILGIKGCRCLDAEHHILHGGVFSADIVVVVGGDEAHAKLPGKLVQAVVDLDLAGNTVVNPRQRGPDTTWRPGARPRDRHRAADAALRHQGRRSWR